MSAGVAAAVWATDGTRLDLEVADSVALKKRLNIQMNWWTHTFVDERMERSYQDFFFTESIAKMRKMVAPWVVMSVVMLVRALLRHNTWQELITSYGTVATTLFMLAVLWRARTPRGSCIDPDAAMCVASIVGVSVSALGVYAVFVDIFERCEDNTCFRENEAARGSNVGMFFGGFAIYVTLLLRRFTHFVLSQICTTAVFVALFGVVNPLGTGTTTFVLLVVLMTGAMAWVNRSADMALRREFIWYRTTLETTRVHLERLETERQHKQRIVGYLFHEVRNPINNIVLASASAVDCSEAILTQSSRASMTDLVRRSVEEVHSMVGIIVQAAQSATLVLDDALNLEKLETGNFAFTHKRFLVRSLYDSSVQTILPRFMERKIQVEVDTVPFADTLHILGDLKRLQQVMQNFLSNAAKFTPQGGRVRVCVKEVRRLNGSIRLQVSVSDNGLGIPKADQHRLFQPWSQIRAAETQGGGGTGLGLSLSKDFVQRGHGGVIGVESPGFFGQGSTFFYEVTFPTERDELMVATNSEASVASAPTTPKSMPGGGVRSARGETPPPDAGEEGQKGAIEASQAGSGAPEHDGGGKRVLVVDDSDITRKLFSRMLQSLGVDHDCCENGQVAIDQFDPDVHALVFMDKEMPLVDGHEATRQIRARCASVVIIGVTGNALDEQRREFLECGATQVVPKPINKAQATAILEKFGLLPPVA